MSISCGKAARRAKGNRYSIKRETRHGHGSKRSRGKLFKSHKRNDDQSVLR